MRDPKSQKFCSYLTYQLFVSQAFQELSPAAKNILMQFYFEIEMSSDKKRSKKYSPTIRNRFEIVLPYREIEQRLGYRARTITTSLKQILAHGFLEKVKRGGSVKGDFAVYSISEKWRQWQPGQTITEMPTPTGKASWWKAKNKQSKISSTLQSKISVTGG
jgi:hypothetical protein